MRKKFAPLLNPRGPRKQPAPVVAESQAQTIITARRHLKGADIALERLFGLTPKCQYCYEARGWLTKCECMPSEMLK